MIRINYENRFVPGDLLCFERDDSDLRDAEPPGAGIYDFISFSSDLYGRTPISLWDRTSNSNEISENECAIVVCSVINEKNCIYDVFFAITPQYVGWIHARYLRKYCVEI